MLPIRSASWGAPVTNTRRPKVTCTSIVSTCPYVVLVSGVLVIDTALTAAAVRVAPLTLWFPLLATAWLPSAICAAVPPLPFMVPLLSASALDPMLIPSASRSVDCTT